MSHVNISSPPTAPRLILVSGMAAALGAALGCSDTSKPTACSCYFCLLVSLADTSPCHPAHEISFWCYLRPHSSTCLIPVLTLLGYALHNQAVKSNRSRSIEWQSWCWGCNNLHVSEGFALVQVQPGPRDCKCLEHVSSILELRFLVPFQT